LSAAHFFLDSGKFDELAESLYGIRNVLILA